MGDLSPKCKCWIQCKCHQTSPKATTHVVGWVSNFTWELVIVGESFPPSSLATPCLRRGPPSKLSPAPPASFRASWPACSRSIGTYHSLFYSCTISVTLGAEALHGLSRSNWNSGLSYCSSLIVRGGSYACYYYFFAKKPADSDCHLNLFCLWWAAASCCSHSKVWDPTMRGKFGCWACRRDRCPRQRARSILQAS